MANVCKLLYRGLLVRDIAKRLKVPRSKVYEWADSEDFRDAYMRARIGQAHAMAEDTIRIADEPVESSEQAARNRLRVDARRWLVTKIAPRIYGERTQTDVNITVNALHLEALQQRGTVTGGTDQPILTLPAESVEVVSASETDASNV